MSMEVHHTYSMTRKQYANFRKRNICFTSENSEFSKWRKTTLGAECCILQDTLTKILWILWSHPIMKLNTIDLYMTAIEHTDRIRESEWLTKQWWVSCYLYPPWSVADSFGNCLHGIDHKFRTIIRVGAIAVIWSLWLYKNDKVFNDKNISLVHVIYRFTILLRSWSILQRVKNRDFLWRCLHNWKHGERYFTQHGWPRDFRIGHPVSLTNYIFFSGLLFSKNFLLTFRLCASFIM